MFSPSINLNHFIRSPLRWCVGAIGLAMLVQGCSNPTPARDVALATAAAARLQTAIAEFMLAKQTWPSVIAELPAAPAPEEQAVASYTLSAGGALMVRFLPSSTVTAGLLTYIPSKESNSSVTWQCNAEGLAAQLVPSECR